jgi:transposase
MKPIALTAEQRAETERRRKGTLDRRIYQRLTAVSAVAAGKSRGEVAELLGVSLTQLGEWLRLYRNQVLDALCASHYKGDPGHLTANQVGQLEQEVGTGCFRNSGQIRQWLQDTFGVSYKPGGVKDLPKWVGVSYHKVTGFLWKADPDKQKEFAHKHQRQKARARREGAWGPDAISWMPAIRSGGWTRSFPAGCWWDSGSW